MNTSPTPEKNAAAQIRSSRTPNGCLQVWPLGQMGYLIKAADQNCILVDPVLSNVVAERVPNPAQIERAFPPPLNPGDLDFIQAVLVTHAHLDHTDPLTIGELARVNPDLIVIGPAEARQVAVSETRLSQKQWIVPKQGEVLHCGNLKVRAIPAAHYTLEFEQDGSSRYISYHLAWPEQTVFHSGDAIAYPGYTQNIAGLPPAQTAILAVNGRDPAREAQDIKGNFFPEEAAALAIQIGWQTVLAGHNDLFAYNALPPERVAALPSMFPSAPPFLLPRVGESITLPYRKP